MNDTDIELKFDVLTENLSGSLKVRHSPLFKITLHALTCTFTLVFSFVIFQRESTILIKLLYSALTAISTYAIVYYLLAFRHTFLMNQASTNKLLSGETETYTYSLKEDAIVEKTAKQEKMYRFSSFIKYKKIGYGHEHLLVFKQGTIYLPKHAISKGDIKYFLAQFNERLM